MNIALTQQQEISHQIHLLQEALVSSNPLMPQMLRKIHEALRNDPETVTLLSDAERCTVIAALMKQTNTTIASTLDKKSGGKTLKSTKLDDI